MEHQENISMSQKLIAAVAEGGWILGFGYLILPLLVWIFARKSSPFVAQHAKQSFMWQLALFGVMAALMIVLAGIAGVSVEVIAVICIVISLPCVLLSAYAVVKALSGEAYSYPLLARL